MSNCARCGWKYPDELLSPLRGSIVTKPICAICAREIRKTIHGADIPFVEGSMARQMEVAAIEWRTEHPEFAPTDEVPK